jgi:uncharacterized membrane protein YfcA
VAGLWRSIRWSRCVPFIVGGLAALPVGTVLLLSVEPRIYACAIGCALVVYGLYMLLRRPRSIGGGERLAALFLLKPQSTPDPAVLAYALPGLAGAVIGLRFFHRLTDVQFQRLVNLALVASGAALAFK